MKFDKNNKENQNFISLNYEGRKGRKKGKGGKGRKGKKSCQKIKFKKIETYKE